MLGGSREPLRGGFAALDRLRAPPLWAAKIDGSDCRGGGRLGTGSGGEPIAQHGVEAHQELAHHRGQHELARLALGAQATAEGGDLRVVADGGACRVEEDDLDGAKPSDREFLYLVEVMQSALGYKAKDIRRGDEMAVSSMLKKLGYDRVRRRINGVLKWVFWKNAANVEKGKKALDKQNIAKVRGKYHGLA